MIKKSVFEDDLIKGMHCELIKQAHNVEVQNLSNAADYLNSAAQILEEIGMIEASDSVIDLLFKLADHKNPPSSKKHPRYEVTHDVSLWMKMLAGDSIAKAKINATLRDAGKNDAEIIETIGFKNFMTEREVRKTLATPAIDIIPKSYRDPELEPEIIEKLEPYEFEIAANRKLKNPTKISDRHTKKLTSEKMVNNLKHHGTVFNMTNDGCNDVLNADIDDNLVVSEDDLMQIGDFEDEID